MDMFYLKWTSHCISHLWLHLQCDIVWRNPFLQNKSMIVYNVMWHDVQNFSYFDSYHTLLLYYGGTIYPNVIDHSCQRDSGLVVLP